MRFATWDNVRYIKSSGGYRFKNNRVLYTVYKKVATKDIYSKDGRFIGRILDEDLLQDMKVEIIKSLPTIRKMLLQKIKKEKSFPNI